MSPAAVVGPQPVQPHSWLEQSPKSFPTTNDSNGTVKPARKGGDSLHIIDDRTGKYYSIPIKNNSVKAADFKNIKAPEKKDALADQDDQGIRVFDPGFSNTAVSESKITFIDGLKGMIQYRGYSIDDIVGKKTFLDTFYLLLWGIWPTKSQREAFHAQFNAVPMLDTNVQNVIRSFPRTGSPMGMMIAGLCALQSADMSKVPARMAKNLYQGNPTACDEQIVRVMSSFSRITAMAYCHSKSIPFTDPLPHFTPIENFLLMTNKVDRRTGLPDPATVSRFERLWTVIADHEMTCSTAAMLQTASALPDVISCLVSALSAMYGPLHGGAIEVAYRSIVEIGSVENIPAKIERVKRGEERLYGYGHRIYKVSDPRYKYIRGVIDELQEEISADKNLKVAFELDRIAARDEYFISRKLRPNADLFAAFAYKAMGFEADWILPISMLSRTQGFMAHWREAMLSPPRIWRPGQIYKGDLNKNMDS